MARDLGSDTEEEQESDTQNRVTETHPQGIYDVTLPARHLVELVHMFISTVFILVTVPRRPG